MQDPKSTSQRIALTRLERIGRLPMALPEIGGSPDIPRTVGPNVSNLALGTAADGAVTPRKTGVHPSARTVGPNVSNLALGTAANGAVTPRKTGAHAKRARRAEPAAWEVSKEFQLDGAWPWSRLLYPKPNVQWFGTQ